MRRQSVGCLEIEIGEISTYSFHLYLFLSKDFIVLSKLDQAVSKLLPKLFDFNKHLTIQ